MRDAEFLYVKTRARISQQSTGILEPQSQKGKGSKYCRQALCFIHLLCVLSPAHGMNLCWNSKETINRGIKCSDVECACTQLRAFPNSIQTLNKQPQGLCLKSWNPFSIMVRHVQAEHRAGKCHPRWSILSQAITASLGAVEGRIVLNTEMLLLQHGLWGSTSPGGASLGLSVTGHITK